MKKTLLTLAATIIGAGSLMAQGNIAFTTTSAFPLRVTDYIVTQRVDTASTLLGQGQVRIQLLVGAAGAAISDMVPITAVSAAGGGIFITNATSTSSAAQGTFNGGNPAAVPASVWVAGSGLTIQFMYQAWSISTGALTYADALNAAQGYVGQSALITGYTPSTGVPTATFGSGVNQLQFLLLHPVPEPTTFALLGLGAAGLLVFRRRKE